MSTVTGQKSGLTTASVKRAKTKNKPYKLSDRDGLYLLVQPNGKRFWRINYRFHGKQKTMAFGRWREILLGSARERLAEARRLLAEGIDPMEQAKLDRSAVSVAGKTALKLLPRNGLRKENCRVSLQ